MRPRHKGVDSRWGEEWSGRRDLNSGPLAPEASALPGCATPRLNSQSSPIDCGLSAEPDRPLDPT